MSVFKRVLVGVDLLQSDGTGSNRFSIPVEEAIKHGLWLAEKASANITFFAVLDMVEDWFHSLQSERFPEAISLHRSGQQTLDRLVDSARQRGLKANAKLVSGEAWIEVIREVEQYGHDDVVIVGQRNAGALHRFLFGGTAMRLLHNCPCPVWVTHPELRPFTQNILVTSDLSPMSDITVRLALAMGDFSGAKVHLLHAVDYLLDRRYSVGLLHTNREHYHANVKAEAHQLLTEQLVRVAGGQLAATVELHIVEGESIADSAIIKFIEHHQIDLLLMGTMARSGLSGVSIGNTAERLVTQLPCSMLAVKPADFKTPIDLNATALP